MMILSTSYADESEPTASNSGRYFASGSCNVMPKKVKADRPVMGEGDKEVPESKGETCPREKPFLVYCRRAKKPRHLRDEPSFLEKVERRIELDSATCGTSIEVKVDTEDDDNGTSNCNGVSSIVTEKKRRRTGLAYEVLKLGESFHLRGNIGLDGVRGDRKLQRRRTSDTEKVLASHPGTTKRWNELSFEGADPLAFIGLSCKVYWPMDDAWYTGSVSGYSEETQKHRIEYQDGDVESLDLAKEKIKFFISQEEMKQLHLKCYTSKLENKSSFSDEMLALAVSYNDGESFEVSDVVWAKVPGYAMWPAVVISEADIDANTLKATRGDMTIPVRFFGTHDFARINVKQLRPFLSGLLSSYHLKCKQRKFEQSLEEVKLYLSSQQLPAKMMHKQINNGEEYQNIKKVKTDGGIPMDDSSSVDWKTVENINACPFELGDLRISCLGKIVCDSDLFHSKNHIWPEGYKASRKFISVTNPSESTIYNMEVLRNPEARARPLLRVTWGQGEKVEGPNPSVWKEIYSRIRRNIKGNRLAAVAEKLQKSGSYMFGFSDSRISKLIESLPNSISCTKYFKHANNLPSTYRAVHIDWKDIDRCNVCHMDEEYEDNLFLQCDKCCMTVHARCYGEPELLDGVLWFCNLCRPGAPSLPPPCSLCPVIGGAMKPTTDGRWAHLTCAIWIPETCLLDIRKMEPIDGLRRISKDRWKLSCSICGVPYGACIQCSNSSCYVAYHPLCARAAGLWVEPEDEDRLHLMSDDEDNHCIRLLSFCKRHMPASVGHSPSEVQLVKPTEDSSTYLPPSNPSGCARSEPYNFFGRRGQKEPQAVSAASVKRLYVENRPYIVNGCCQNEMDCLIDCHETSENYLLAKFTMHQASTNIASVGEKYKYMKTTYRKRLAFGKSKVHGFGVFAKVPHKTGDMIIEYTGELVRPPIADIREHLIYDSLVGAGTYMFRIDNERVVDATKAGSIAQLINHSCEPNCYSRMVTVNGDDHIIIFAKRDISPREELSYDYRFLSKDQKLACYCGSSRCRGVVNDIEAQGHMAKLWVPRRELIPWLGD